MRTKMNLYYELLKNGIVPTNKYMYNVTQILNTLHNIYKTHLIITCIYNNILNKYLLAEIYVCFDKNFKFINCLSNDIHNGCNETKILYNKI
jgi:hypothetical protein